MAAIKSPKRSVDYFIRLASLLTLLIVVAGLAMQNVQINLFAQTDVDEVYAQAVAEQMSKALELRLQDTRRLQVVASSHAYTLNALRHGDSVWVKDLKLFMPGSESVLLVSAEESRNLHLSYGYAVQELVTRTLRGTEMRLEALKKQDQQLRLYWATPVLDGTAIVGVLLVEYGPAWVAQFQAAASQELGEVTVVQYVDDKQKYAVEIFHAGSAKNAGKRVTVPIVDDWYLSFVPNDERPKLALMPLSTPWMVVLVALVIVLLALVYLQNIAVRKNQYRLLTYLRELQRSSTAIEKPKFGLKLFYDLCELLTHQYARLYQQNKNQEATMATAEEPAKRPIIRKQAQAPGLIIEELNDDADLS